MNDYIDENAGQLPQDLAPSASDGTSSVFPSPAMKHYADASPDWGAFGRYLSEGIRKLVCPFQRE